MTARIRQPRPRAVRRRGGARSRSPAGGAAVAALAAALLLPAAPAPAAAQGVDSAEVVEEVRDRQRDFERHRRLRLPPTGSGTADRCDERVGRYCLFHGEGPGWEPRAEHPDVRRGRWALIRRLDRAARALPGDGWIAGQRVRYLVGADRPVAAARAARSCRAEAWWCRALEAFALHHAGEPRPADDLFADALAAMPDSTRRRWIDPTALLEDEAADRLEALEGASRDAWLERLWWLADPLWSVPGSGRRVGHLARRVRCRLQRDADGPYGTAWGDDLAELTLRYGWPIGFERVRSGHYGLGAEPTVVAHHDASARRTVPPAPVLETPSRAGPESWPLDPDEPRSEYAPPALDTLVRPAVRIARFPRPDSLRLVAAWRWEEGDGAEASLRLEAGPGGPAADAGNRQRGRYGRLSVAAPPRPAVASLELVDRGDRVAARHRTGVRPPGRPEGVPGLSDLLLTGPSAAGGTGRTDPEPDAAAGVLRRARDRPTLAEAAARARPPGPARPGERVGLYWEAYGRSSALRGGRTEVRLVGDDGGFLGGLARGLGLADDPREVSVGWPSAPVREGRIHPTGLVLALPATLEPGRYEVEVTLRPPGREPVTARTSLRVVEPED